MKSDYKSEAEYIRGAGVTRYRIVSEKLEGPWVIPRDRVQTINWRRRSGYNFAWRAYKSARKEQARLQKA